MRGFTLLEILLVMALVSGAMVMMAAALARGGDGSRLRVASSQMANGLRDTRARAMLNQVPERFELNLQARHWQAAGRSAQPVSTGIDLTMTTASELRTPAGGSIVFFPDGASTGGRVELAQGGQVWRLDVNWLTGQVRTTRVSAP